MKPQLSPKNLNSTNLAYFAGYFDGEGYITMPRSQDKKAPQLRVGIGSADLEVLEAFHVTFGGGLTQEPTSTVKREIYRWSCSGEQAKIFLALLEPFLLTPKSRVIKDILALDYTHKRLTPEELSAREAAATRLRDINQRTCQISLN